MKGHPWSGPARSPPFSPRFFALGYILTQGQMPGAEIELHRTPGEETVRRAAGGPVFKLI